MYRNIRRLVFKMPIFRMADNCLHILFPPRCAACRARLDSKISENFCERCASEIHYIRSPFCRVCGLEVHGAAEATPLCGECLNTQPSFSIARSLVRYELTIQQLVHKLKYSRDTSVIPGIVELITGYDLSEFLEIDYIVPVPLHLRRLRQRGLNQALLLARLLFPERGELIRADLLIRTRNTVPQTELGGAERRDNLKTAFQLRNGYDVNGFVVCLVDDVFTTGATVEECSRVILKSGAREVKVLTLARAGFPKRGRF
jgi:ComF family protein